MHLKATSPWNQCRTRLMFRILFLQFLEKTHFLCCFLLSPQSPIGTGHRKMRLCTGWADLRGHLQMRERFREVASPQSKFSNLVMGLGKAVIVCYRGL